MANRDLKLLVYKVICGSLGLSLLICCYLLQKEVGFRFIYDKYIDADHQIKQTKISSEEEFNFISSALNKYYSIGMTTAPEEKIQTIRKIFSEPLVAEISEQQLLAISHFNKLGGSQSISIRKITYLKQQKLYEVYLNIFQNFPKSQTSQFLVNLRFRIAKDEKTQFKIDRWQERILTIQPEIYSNNDFKSDSEFVSVAKLPCKIDSVAPVNDKNEIEVKLNANSQTLNFHAKKPIIEDSVFKAMCGQRSFILTISSDPEIVTVFQNLNLEDGQISSRKVLTHHEKVDLSIKNQLKSWGMEESKN